jgi:hypothetical protein
MCNLHLSLAYYISPSPDTPPYEKSSNNSRRLTPKTAEGLVQILLHISGLYIILG